MAPGPASAPSGELAAAITRDFGSLDNLKRTLRTAVLDIFGSGWAWLVFDSDGCLTIQKTANQEVPLPLCPLLACDVWEHAYYLSFQNRRAEYFENWWQVLAWPQLSDAYHRHQAVIPRCPHP